MPSTLQNLYNEYITPKFWKDVKFGIISFVALCCVIFNYGWIMRQLLLNRDLSYEKITAYFAVLGLNCFVLGYIVLVKVYPIVYKEEVSQEKEKKEQ